MNHMCMHVKCSCYEPSLTGPQTQTPTPAIAGDEAAKLAQAKATQAAQTAADARGLMYRVLSDAAEMLGLHQAGA
jgi:hypothetical protein